MTSVEGTVSGEELARWLGLSEYDLAKAGILVRVGRSYRQEESVRRYCDYLRRVPAMEVPRSLSRLDSTGRRVARRGRLSKKSTDQ
jgi:hypothetical protein